MAELHPSITSILLHIQHNIIENTLYHLQDTHFLSYEHEDNVPKASY